MVDDPSQETISLPVDIAGIFSAEVMEQVTVLIVGGLYQGEALSAGTDNGDGTFTLLEPDIQALSDLRLVLSEDATGVRELAVTAISGDGRVETGHLSADPSLAVVERALTAALDQPVVDEEAGGIVIPLRIALAGEAVALVDDVSFVLSGLPDGASLSAGSDLGDGGWRLGLDDTAGLTLTLADIVEPRNLSLVMTAAGRAGGAITLRRALTLELPRALVAALGGIKEPSPEERAVWMVGAGVFTFAGGQGDDLFAEGYGWTDAVDDASLAESAGERDAGERDAGEGGAPVLTVRRIGAAGLRLGGGDPVKW